MPSKSKSEKKCLCGCGKSVLGKGRMYFLGHKPKEKAAHQWVPGKVVANGMGSVVSAIDKEIGDLTVKIVQLREVRALLDKIAA